MDVSQEEVTAEVLKVIRANQDTGINAGHLMQLIKDYLSDIPRKMITEALHKLYKTAE